jgi:threonine/homoserine/homoserine lactone efflux protein
VPLDAHLVWTFALAAFVLIVIPGPSVVFVIGRALSYGRGVAVASVVGNTTGLFCVMVLVSVGLGAIVAESRVVFTVLKLAGAAYLVWLGIQALRHRRGLQVEDGVRTPLGWWPAFRQGFVVGVSNPKGFMIFAALLPQFVDRSGGSLTAQLLILGLVAVVLGLVCDLTWAMAASRMREWFNASPKRGEALGLTGGVSMIGLGVVLALTGRPE